MSGVGLGSGVPVLALLLSITSPSLSFLICRLGIKVVPFIENYSMLDIFLDFFFAFIFSFNSINSNYDYPL